MRVRFGPYKLDAATRQLVRDGSDIHLSPKAFDLLCRLVERRPEVVEKTELLERIWPGTYVVEASLNVLIGEIRRALGDDARQPRFIRTVHGVGYAFRGDATEIADSPGSARAMPCWLISSERKFRLTEGENIIGRDPSSAVWLDTPSVSRRHARVTVESSSRRVVLEDLNSTNGCAIGGTAIRGATELTDGEAISIGSVELRVCLWNAAGAETVRIRRKRR